MHVLSAHAGAVHPCATALTFAPGKPGGGDVALEVGRRQGQTGGLAVPLIRIVLVTEGRDGPRRQRNDDERRDSDRDQELDHCHAGLRTSSSMSHSVTLIVAYRPQTLLTFAWIDTL